MRLGYRALICKISGLALGVCFASASAFATTIPFQFSALSTPGEYQFTYSLAGLSLTAMEQIDFQFSASVYSTVFNGIANIDFQVLTLQPNNPPSAFGDFILISQVNNPSLTGPFSVDVTFSGPVQPGPQTFVINQLDSNQHLINPPIDSGSTSPEFVSDVVSPEPATYWVCGAALLLIGVARAVRGVAAT